MQKYIHSKLICYATKFGNKTANNYDFELIDKLITYSTVYMDDIRFSMEY